MKRIRQLAVAFSVALAMVLGTVGLSSASAAEGDGSEGNAASTQTTAVQQPSAGASAQGNSSRSGVVAPSAQVLDNSNVEVTAHASEPDAANLSSASKPFSVNAATVYQFTVTNKATTADTLKAGSSILIKLSEAPESIPVPVDVLLQWTNFTQPEGDMFDSQIPNGSIKDMFKVTLKKDMLPGSASFSVRLNVVNPNGWYDPAIGGAQHDFSGKVFHSVISATWRNAEASTDNPVAIQNADIYTVAPTNHAAGGLPGSGGAGYNQENCKMGINCRADPSGIVVDNGYRDNYVSSKHNATENVNVAQFDSSATVGGKHYQTFNMGYLPYQEEHFGGGNGFGCDATVPGKSCQLQLQFDHHVDPSSVRLILTTFDKGDAQDCTTGQADSAGCGLTVKPTITSNALGGDTVTADLNAFVPAHTELQGQWRQVSLIASVPVDSTQDSVSCRYSLSYPGMTDWHDTVIGQFQQYDGQNTNSVYFINHPRQPYDTETIKPTDGLSAYVGDKDVSDKITVDDLGGYPADGKNPAPGTYDITYSVPKDGVSGDRITYHRTIVVKQNKANLKVQDVSMTAGDVFNPQAAFVSALDQNGNSLPFERVSVDQSALNRNVKGTYQVTYSLGNLSGKTYTAVSNVTVTDASSLKVKDSNVKLGSSWSQSDNFVSATDTDGTALGAEKMSVDTPIDTSHVGPKQVTYKFTDKAGHDHQAIATVTVYSDVTVHYVDTDGNKLTGIKDKDGDTIDNPTKIEAQVGKSYTISHPSSLKSDGTTYYLAGGLGSYTGTFGSQNQAVDVTLTYGLDKTSVKTQNVSFVLGNAFDRWSGFISATDKYGNAISGHEGITIDVGRMNSEVAGTYQVTYSIKNSDDETISSTSTVTVKDLSAVHVRNSTLTQGDSWQPSDNFIDAYEVDGSAFPFDRIKVSGSVNTNAVGSYKVKYALPDRVLHNGIPAPPTSAVANVTVTPKSDGGNNGGSDNGGNGNHNGNGSGDNGNGNGSGNGGNNGSANNGSGNGNNSGSGNGNNGDSGNGGSNGSSNNGGNGSGNGNNGGSDNSGNGNNSGSNGSGNGTNGNGNGSSNGANTNGSGNTNNGGSNGSGNSANAGSGNGGSGNANNGGTNGSGNAGNANANANGSSNGGVGANVFGSAVRSISGAGNGGANGFGNGTRTNANRRTYVYTRTLAAPAPALGASPNAAAPLPQDGTGNSNPDGNSDLSNNDGSTRKPKCVNDSGKVEYYSVDSAAWLVAQQSSLPKCSAQASTAPAATHHSMNWWWLLLLLLLLVIIISVYVYEKNKDNGSDSPQHSAGNGDETLTM